MPANILKRPDYERRLIFVKKNRIEKNDRVKFTPNCVFDQRSNNLDYISLHLHYSSLPSLLSNGVMKLQIEFRFNSCANDE